jgi:hypothetical protein
LALQAAQAFRAPGVASGARAACWRVAGHGTEIHQAATEAEQHGGQAGAARQAQRGHGNVPEIVTRLGDTVTVDDRCVKARSAKRLHYFQVLPKRLFRLY